MRYEFNFIQSLDPQYKNLFDHCLNIEADQMILGEGDEIENVLFLLSGEIEVYKYSENGKVFRLYTIQPGESCVLNLSCILSDLSYSAYAKALTNIQCILIPRSEFLEMFSQNESLRNYVFKLISSRLIQITARVEGIVLDSLEHRLKRLLLDEGKSVVYTTHEELAIKLGSAREVISRLLKKWEKQGWIKLYRGKIQILELT
jgi:CRP/FNR family transcriptional regulator, anaerobic regulatory protein